MKYRLKDQMLQKKLDEISGGDFSKKLSETIERELSYPLQNPISAIPVAFGDWGADVYGDQSPRYIVRFHIDEIESVPSYDPHGWNEWPKVTPPEVDIYRVEVFRYADDSDPEVRVAGYWDGKGWRADDPDGGGYCYIMSGEIIRFRPWEEE